MCDSGNHPLSNQVDREDEAAFIDLESLNYFFFYFFSGFG